MLHIKVKNGYKWTQTNMFLICIKNLVCLCPFMSMHLDIIKLGSLSWINGKVHCAQIYIYRLNIKILSAFIYAFHNIHAFYYKFK